MNSFTSRGSEEIGDRWIWLLLCTAGLLRFLNLGFLDLQAWDEALYTVRAQSILYWGHWLDQSEHTIGGLYSALHPPLQVWLTALVFKILHVSEFSARVVSAFAAASTLPVIYFIGKEIEGKKVGLVAALLYGLTPLAVFISRQGQFDAFLTFWLTLSAYWFIKSLRERSRPLISLAGIAVGMGLMTKLFVALGIPLVYAIWILVDKPDDAGSHWRRLATLGAFACAIALPWHLFMTVMHGQGDLLFMLRQSSLIQRSVGGVEGNVKSLEVFYYVNQLIVVFPLGLCWFLFALWESIRSKSASWLFLSLWFLVFFAVFSVMRTKLDFYVVPMLIPMSLLAAKNMSSAVAAPMSTKRAMMLLSGTWIATVWSSSQTWRNAAKEFILSSVHLKMPAAQAIHGVISLLLLSSLGVLLVVLIYRRGYLKHVLAYLGLVILVPLFLAAVVQVEILDRTQHKDGGYELARFIDLHEIRRIVVAGFDRNPQLTYYMREADIGWRDDLEIRRIVPPPDTLLYRSWLEREMSREASGTLLLIEKDKFIRYQTVNPESFVPVGSYRVFESRRYSGYLRTSGSYYARYDSTVDSGLLSH